MSYEDASYSQLVRNYGLLKITKKTGGHDWNTLNEIFQDNGHIQTVHLWLYIVCM
jgi:hypothetical protein